MIREAKLSDLSVLTELSNVLGYEFYELSENQFTSNLTVS